MVLDTLGSKLRDALGKIASSVFVDERKVNELVKEIQRALLQADVNVKLVLELSNGIKKRVLKEKPVGTVSKREQVVHIVYEELVKFLGESEQHLEIKVKPTKLMLVGLYGSGKTTQAAKLAHFYKKRGKSVAMVQLDVWRPAAYEQLLQLGKQIKVPVFGNPKEKNPRKIYKAVKKDLEPFDLVIVDTAGRDALSTDLIKEIDDITKLVAPQEVLLVVSADIGQTAQKQAEVFHDTCGVTGIVITKLDGTAKGGGALAACSVTGAKVMFIGVGEKIPDLEVFRPEGFVSRLLGMGDLEALLEKVKDAVTEEEAEDLSKRFLKGDFNLLDLYEQMRAMSKMGPLSKVVEMIPGFSSLKLPKEMLQVQEEKLHRWRHAMDSMTKEELENPDVFNVARINRISNGSGVKIGEIRELVKQYRMSRKLVRSMKGMAGSPKDMKKMMRKMGGAKGLKGLGMQNMKFK